MTIRSNKTGSTIQYGCFLGLQIKQCILKDKKKCQAIDNLVIFIQKSRNYVGFFCFGFGFFKLHLGLQINTEQKMLKNTTLQTTLNPAH